jgi:hypothetical protein
MSDTRDFNQKKQSYYETMHRYNKEFNDDFYLISIKSIRFR